MSTTDARALVVDDEEQVQKLIANALRQQGVQCDVAGDGARAESLASASSYDVVVTDLKMPRMNGHALVLKLLELERRPLIIVHTGVIEPKLAKDLLQRGVDDILFKPINFAVLAAKVVALLERRRAAEPRVTPLTEATNGRQMGQRTDDERISISRLHEKLTQVSSVLPMSNAALEVFSMTRDGEFLIGEIAAAVQRDASFTADVLRLANSSHYNNSGQLIGGLEQAILRIGQKRIGEMALATSSMAALTPGALPWMDIELAWKRSLASGIVLEMLIDDGSHLDVEEGLLISAILQPLGRAVLGMLFPKHYEKMTRHCLASGETLRDLERTTFPTSPTEVLAQLLSHWNLPSDVYLPLKFSHDDASSLTRLPEPIRTRAELVKTAVTLGRVVVGRWQDWDLVQLPNAWQLRRLGIQDAANLLDRARADLGKLASFCPSGVVATKANVQNDPVREIAYCDLSDFGDVFAEVIHSLGLRAIPCSSDQLRDTTTPILVNAVGVPASQFGAVRASDKALIVTDAENLGGYDKLGRAIALTSGYGRLKRAVLECFVGTDAPLSRLPNSQAVGVLC